ncbi:MAG: ribose 5-phosphate isomerase B [Nitrospirae bacterium]|nr:ribose 5-phosphate isomerase B [Nitrospirota bacterium]
MKIAIGCDHAGVELKNELITLLKNEQIDVINFGTDNNDSVDYPDFAKKVASSIKKNEVDRGILICGTGIGMSIAANRYKGIRAALCHDIFTAQMSRLHNDSNVLVIGSRIVDIFTAEKIVKIWLCTEFEGGRHDNRLCKIRDIED